MFFVSATGGIGWSFRFLTGSRGLAPQLASERDASLKRRPLTTRRPSYVLDNVIGCLTIWCALLQGSFYLKSSVTLCAILMWVQGVRRKLGDEIFQGIQKRKPVCCREPIIWPLNLYYCKLSGLWGFWIRQTVGCHGLPVKEWIQILESNEMDAEMESWQVDIYNDLRLGAL